MVIKEYQQQVEQAQEQVNAFNPNIQRTQKMLRTAPQGGSVLNQRIRLNELERQRGVAKTKAQSQIDEANAKLNEVLNTDAGKIQYAKEYGIEGEPIYDRLGPASEGYNLEIVGYRYNTPYGEVVDYSPKQKLLYDEAKQEARDAGFGGNVEEYLSVSKTFNKIFQNQALKEIQNAPILDARENIVTPQTLKEINAQSRSSPPINPKTGLPYNVVSKASTEKDLFNKAINERNPVSGAIDYALGFAREKLEPFFRTQYGQNPFLGETGNKAQEVIKNIPYFIPATSAPYALAMGIGQVTPGGIKEIQNAPTIGEKATLAGTGALNLIFGGIGTTAMVGRSLGFPKYNTNFLTTEISNADDLKRIRTLARTQEKNLLSNRNIFSLAISDVKSLPENQAGRPFVTRTFGLSREYAIQLPDGKPVGIGKPTKFIAGEGGVSTNKPVRVLVGENNGLKMYRTFEEGTEVRSVGEVQSERINKIIKAKKINQKYGTAGVTGNVNENTDFGLFKSIPYKRVDGEIKVSKPGQIISSGFFKREPSDFRNSIFINTGEGKGFSVPVEQTTKTLNAKAIGEQSTKTAIETSLRSQAEAKQASDILKSQRVAKATGAISPILNQQNSNTYSTGSQILASDNKQNTITSQAPKTNDKVALGTLGIQQTALKQQNILDQLTKINTDLSQEQKTGQATNQRLDQQQQEKQIQKTKQLTPTANRNKDKKFAFWLPGGETRLKKALGKLKNYKIFKRIKGKDLLIDKAENPIKASQLLKKALKSDTSASGFIENPLGRKLNASEIGLSNEFGQSKRQAFRLIQKRGFRLGTRSEVSDIQFFKRTNSKKRKKGRLSWW